VRGGRRRVRRETGRARAGTERGSATVLTVGAAAAVLLVLTGVLVVSGVVRDVHRARAAADLAALAAVGRVASGGGADCEVAAVIAAVNGAVLTECVVEPGGSVLVSVTVGHRWAQGWGGLPSVVSGRARAGVVDAP
jgi:secretion/DNA translocation related TadE-like protein